MHQNPSLSFLQQRLRVVAVVALSSSIFSAAQAQNAPATIRLSPEDATRGLNGHQHNFDFLAPGVEGYNYQTAGFFGQRLRPYLASNAESVAYLDKYRRQKTIFLIDRLVAVGSFGVYGQQIFANGEAQYFNNTQKVAIGIFATSVLATVFINRNTNTHLQRAVTAYNTGRAQIRLLPRLRPTSIGLGTAPTGQPLLALRWTVR
ncbi:hypothetical protein I2I05_13675 [Hymenobacter sp. BT683]|uniref:DUF5683 domain-containing protein n=1 Tax=Hymenobacter jeongseonensis TaxID=2791027 RepID=A0ABS0IJB6_9BACT|nr:hypothetical protein [Hymenobacter jeongseonensis]MBF9238450.1 hypothetical protein [Hymenobacter jeongseonensis]